MFFVEVAGWLGPITNNERKRTMIKRLFDRLLFKERQIKNRRTRAAILLDYLDQHGSLVLDNNGLSAIGMSRKQAFQTLYDLIIHESVQMRAEADGQVVVMSNAEYIRQMEERARETWKCEADLRLETDSEAIDLEFVACDEDNADFLSGEL